MVECILYPPSKTSAVVSSLGITTLPKKKHMAKKSSIDDKVSNGALLIRSYFLSSPPLLFSFLPPINHFFYSLYLKVGNLLQKCNCYTKKRCNKMLHFLAISYLRFTIS